MLDDLKYIHEKDAQDALGSAEKQWQQLDHDFGVEWPGGKEADKVRNIIVAGMGGSALAASLIKSWPGIGLPFEVVRDYALPRYADSHTLVIASSYSGNTEETQACLKDAEKRGCQIAVIAAGGALRDAAKEKNYPFYKVPSGFQPRMAVFYNFAALIHLLESISCIKKGSADELKETANWLKEQTVSWLPTERVQDNQAKQLALELMGKSPVIYGGPLLFPAAYKWKINFNENAKNVAWCGALPEFNHNEFLGWSSHPVEKPYGVIDLRSSLEHPKVQKRFEVSERLLSGLRPAPHVVEAQGDTILQHLLWTITLGDFVSLYLALLNGLNPTPVDLIEKLKKEL